MNPPGRFFLKNTLLNMLGQVAPSLVAVATIPYIIRGWGVERFGILSLDWVLLGYFSIIDFGLGRGATKFVAEELGTGNVEAVPAIVWTSLTLQSLLGTVAGAVLAILAHYLDNHLLNVSPDLLTETRNSFYPLSVCLPAVLCSGSLKGFLEAAQRFDLVNAIRVPSTAAAFLLPAFGVAFGLRLPGVIALMALSLYATALVQLLLCLRVFPQLRRSFTLSPALARRLFSYGGWVTICGILVPLLVSSERFFIGALISAVALGYYTAPSEMAARLQIVPSSFGAALFPAFSALAATGSRELNRLYMQGMKYVLLVMAPIVLIVIAHSADILRLWLGDIYAAKTAGVLAWLAVGRLLNAISQVPANLLDGAGRPDLRAKIFLCYGLISLLLSWIMIQQMGILGAAVAWALRGGFELLIFFIVAWRLLKLEATVFTTSGLPEAFGITGLLIGLTLVWVSNSQHELWIRTLATAACLLAFFVGTWCFALTDDDKNALRGLFRRMPTPSW